MQHYSRRAFYSGLALTAASIFTAPVLVAPVLAQNETQAQSVAKITPVQYNGRAAYRLTDGKIEAVVVPSLGRLMKLSTVGGRNLMWNSPPEKLDIGGWKNWGGDKNWPAPQHRWPEFYKGGWPPPSDWDGKPHLAQVMPGGILKTWNQPDSRLGIRITREYSISGDELVVRQIGEKVSGDRVLASIWNIAQIPAPDAVYLPTNPQSAYKNNYYRFGWGANPPATTISPTLLKVVPAAKGANKGYKVGVDSTVSSMVAVWEKTALLLRSARPDGNYPDGADGAGFPVELYDSDNSERALHYIELELLSPMRMFPKGAKWTHTLRYGILELPSDDLNSAETNTQIEQMLNIPADIALSAVS
jgi:hypothetical protein